MVKRFTKEAESNRGEAERTMAMHRGCRKGLCRMLSTMAVCGALVAAGIGCGPREVVSVDAVEVSPEQQQILDQQRALMLQQADAMRRTNPGSSANP